MRHQRKRPTAFLRANPGAIEKPKGKDKGKPKVDTPNPVHPDSRYARSHVNEHGHPKATYLSVLDAKAAAAHDLERYGIKLLPYVCWQSPEHFHLGKAGPPVSSDG